MEEYNFKAINSNGITVTGSIKGDNYSKVLKELESTGLQPFYLNKSTVQEKKESKHKTSSSNSVSFSLNKHNSVLLFTKQLANLLKAGIQLDEALDIIINLLKGKVI